MLRNAAPWDTRVVLLPRCMLRLSHPTPEVTSRRLMEWAKFMLESDRQRQG